MTDHDTTDAEIRQAIRDRIEPQEYRDDEQAWCAVDAAVKVITEREARKDAEIARMRDLWPLNGFGEDTNVKQLIANHRAWSKAAQDEADRLRVELEEVTKACNTAQRQLYETRLQMAVARSVASYRPCAYQVIPGVSRDDGGYCIANATDGPHCKAHAEALREAASDAPSEPAPDLERGSHAPSELALPAASEGTDEVLCTCGNPDKPGHCERCDDEAAHGVATEGQQ